MTRACLSTISLVCPVGLTVESACAAMRAGVDGFCETSYLHQDGRPVVASFVRELPLTLTPQTRMNELATLAIDQARARLPRALAIEHLPIITCCESGCVSTLERAMDRLGVPIHPRLVTAVSKQRASVLVALERATHLLKQHQACLVVAFDSLVSARRLLALEEVARLKSPDESDGVIPGEAAGVLLVTSKPLTSSCTALLGLGFGEEEASLANTKPILGTGMAEAVRRALSEASSHMHDVDFRVSDAAGDSAAFVELSLALSRVLRRQVDELPLWHPAGTVGDCGAAAALVQLALVERAFASGYAPGPLALCHASGPSTLRGSAVVRRHRVSS